MTIEQLPNAPDITEGFFAVRVPSGDCNSDEQLLFGPDDNRDMTSIDPQARTARTAKRQPDKDARTAHERPKVVPIHVIAIDEFVESSSEGTFSAEALLSEIQTNGGITPDALRNALIERGISKSDAKKVVNFLVRAEDATRRPILAEFWCEWTIASYIAENFWETNASSSSDIRQRRGAQPLSLSDVVRRVLKTKRQLEANFAPEDIDRVLVATDFEARDLFYPGAVREEEKPVPFTVACEVAKWLLGPYANISSAEELRKIVLDMTDIQFAPRRKRLESWKTCTEDNPAAGRILRERAIFVVPVATVDSNGSTAFPRHYFNCFTTLDGQTFYIDHTARQYKVKKLAHDPFVGDNATLAHDLIEYGAPVGSIVDFTGAQPHDISRQGVNHEYITRMHSRLNDAEA